MPPRSPRAAPPKDHPVSPADLGRFHIFADLSADLLEAAHAKMAVREVAAGEQWSPAEIRLMLVWRGYVRLTRNSPVGQHVTLRSARAGDTLGAPGMFAEARPEKYHFVADLPGRRGGGADAHRA